MNYPQLIKYNGGKDRDFSAHNFKIDSDTEVFGSCSAMLNGEYYIFGGSSSEKRQASTFI